MQSSPASGFAGLVRGTLGRTLQPNVCSQCKTRSRTRESRLLPYLVLDALDFERARIRTVRSMTDISPSLDTYRLLGRSGLRVSPLSLGAMTFGSAWGWGADESEARTIFDAYVDRGGNFVDTASNYTQGTSERLVGDFAKGRH